MKKLIILFLIIQSVVAYGQTKNDHVQKTFFTLTPYGGKTKKIVYGVALGFQAMSDNDDTLIINGLNIEGGIIGPWVSMYMLILGSSGFYSNCYDDDSTEASCQINGLSLSCGGLFKTSNKGVMLNLISCAVKKSYGMQVSTLSSSTVDFRGIELSGLLNIATHGKGLMIGLINNCQSGNVVQIGLINRIGKRVMPFINMSLNSKKK